jgi:hypothetical protein
MEQRGFTLTSDEGLIDRSLIKKWNKKGIKKERSEDADG